MRSRRLSIETSKRTCASLCPLRSLSLRLALGRIREMRDYDRDTRYIDTRYIFFSLLVKRIFRNVNLNRVASQSMKRAINIGNLYRQTHCTRSMRCHVRFIGGYRREAIVARPVTRINGTMHLPMLCALSIFTRVPFAETI